MTELARRAGPVLQTSMRLAMPFDANAHHDTGPEAALTSVEICAGGGGQALGIEQAGFRHLALVEIDKHACATLRLNRPGWNVIQDDLTELRHFSGSDYQGIDLVAGGVPCPPFSKAGFKLGVEDERNLFPAALQLVEECAPQAVMFENVPGLMEAGFTPYRRWITDTLRDLGYMADWRLLNASDYGVPQLRPRVLCVALRPELVDRFTWPAPLEKPPPTVGEALLPEMMKGGWEGAKEWALRACRIAPTLVGGSTKHGGPDLGPTRAKRAWADLGVDGLGIADGPPPPGFQGMPRLTVQMTAILQGFPESWRFAGRKTAAYRQIGNAFPPPVARAVATQIRLTLEEHRQTQPVYGDAYVQAAGS